MWVNHAPSGDGLLAGVTDPKGNASVMTWDAKGNLLTDTDAVGRTVALTKDPGERNRVYV